MTPGVRTLLMVVLGGSVAACAAIAGLGSSYSTGGADGGTPESGSHVEASLPDTLQTVDARPHDAGAHDATSHDAHVVTTHDATTHDTAPPVEAGVDSGELSADCGSSPVFVDNYSGPSAPGAGYTTILGTWVRAPGTYTVTDPTGPGYSRAYALIADSVDDFDVTISGHSIGGDGFGLIYGTTGIGDGYAVIVHPNQFHGLYFKQLFTDAGDDNIAVDTLPDADVSAPFTLHVVRTAGQASITLSGPTLGTPLTLQGTEQGPPSEGRIGLVLSLTTDMEGVVFTDFVVKTASCVDGG
jgi:hypothetical protein